VTAKAKAFIAAVITAGAATLALALIHWRSDDVIRFFVYLLLFAAAATLKWRVPGVTGTYSPVFFFALLGSATLSFSEVAVASALGGIVQCTFRPQRRPSLLQICFNAANLTISSCSAVLVVQPQILGLPAQPLLIALMLGASVCYFVNTALVSVVLTLAERKSFAEVWKHWCLGSLPFYLVGAAIVAATLSAQSPVSLVATILVTPPILLTTMYYRLWLRDGSGSAIQSRGISRGR
jgi:hypothetical protein